MFKIGNIVRKTNSYWGGSLGDLLSEAEKNELYCVKGSYGELYGNGNNGGDYCIVSMETGSEEAWWTEKYLEFVEEGNPNILKELEKKNNQLEKLHSDLHWIINNFSRQINSASILTLFRLIGFQSSFERNGEFFILYEDWYALFPIFETLVNGNYNEAVEYIRKIFKPEYQDGYITNVMQLYEQIEREKKNDEYEN